MSEIIKSQCEILAELRRFDEKIIRLKGEMDLIPINTQKLQNHLQEQDQRIQRERNLYEGIEKKLRKLEQDLKEKEDSLQKAQGKMMEVKTNEEYQAALKENEGKKGEKSGLEDQILTLLSEADENRRRMKEVEHQCKEIEQAAKQDLRRLEDEKNKLNGLFYEQQKSREATLVRLSDDTRTLYQRVSLRTQGVPVVVVENGKCQGCNMIIRPQLFNEVIGFQAIHRCPTCGRILIASASGAPQSEDYH